jgi:SHS2 domain-containing protein
VNVSTRYLDHPSDTGIEAHGATQAEAFSRAAAALISLFLDPSKVEATEQRCVSLTATDEEQLLVRWLSEVLYLYDGQGFVAKEFSMTTCTATAIEAEVRGGLFDPQKHATRTEIKAITYHQLGVWREESGWGLRVFVDL